MKLISHLLCLALAVALVPSSLCDHHEDDPYDRCNIEMDAITMNEDGVPYFFKGDHLFKGFHGKAEFSNESFAEMDDDHHLGHVDAAFIMHYEDGSDHDHIFFFLDNKVFSYYDHKLEDGYPKNISEAFPGIPDHLDAAVECPKPDCEEHSIIFFKGLHIYHFNIKNKAVDDVEFQSMPNCTSAFRFMNHYYCFHGHEFSKFDPKTGEVHGKYPKEARGYFMRCEFGKEGNQSVHKDRETCSRVHLDAITSDHDGHMYAYRAHYFLHKAEGSSDLITDQISHVFKDMDDEVDAVFSYQDHLHMIHGDQVFSYKASEPHTKQEGYPQTVKEELDLEGPIDAAFVCEDHHIAHVIKGDKIYDVELNATSRVATNEQTIPLFKKVHAAMCDAQGVTVVVGHHYYRFASLEVFLHAKALPQQHTVAEEMFDCDH
ncbi:hemopexin [Antennarius striatus]|uniref:hemopexin n=1 Tax=Antennarius striatus TaxID=241820 RepID=UPI0035B0D5C1